jgi:hypothetical protein
MPVLAIKSLLSWLVSPACWRATSLDQRCHNFYQPCVHLFPKIQSSGDIDMANFVNWSMHSDTGRNSLVGKNDWRSMMDVCWS